MSLTSSSKMSKTTSLEAQSDKELNVRSSTKKAFDIEIADYPLRLRTHHDEAMVQMMVDFVDGKIRQSITSTKSGSLQNAAILAALNIAEELILLKRKASLELDRLEEKTNRLRLDLENSKGQKLESSVNRNS
jgi:cell division protein ZapA